MAFVPHRLTDGYDYGAAGLAAARAAGAKLILTGDCGVLAHEWIAKAMDEGIEVIVTDHRRNHSSEIHFLSTKFNTGLTNDFFSVRTLQRGN